MAAEQLRVGIAGTGFIGTVHARSARLAGARVVAVAASSPESAQAAAVALRRRARGRLRRGAGRGPGASTSSTSARPTTSTSRSPQAALAAGKHVVCEKPLAIDAAGAEQLVAAAAAAGPPGRGALRLPLLPDRPRGARAGRARVRPGACTSARHLPPGLAAAPRGRQLARGREPRRRLARLRRHRLALVRPRRVRHRPAHHPALGADAHGRAGARSAARAHMHSPAATARGELRPVSTEDAAVVQFETDARRARLGRDQPGLGRPQEPALDRDRRLRGGAGLRPGAAGELWVGRREPQRRSSGATRSRCRPRRPATRRSPAAIPQGYADCFDAFVADFYEAIETGAGARRPAAVRRRPARRRASPRPCWPRRRAGSGSTWPPPTRRWPGEARLPERLHARAQPRGHRRVGAAQRLRGARARRLAATRRPPVHRQPRRGRRLRRRGGRPRTRGSRGQRPRAVRARLLRQQPASRPRGARGGPRPPARVHRRRRGARRRARSAPSSAATRAAASRTTCARPSASSRRSSTTPASAAFA